MGHPRRACPAAPTRTWKIFFADAGFRRLSSLVGCPHFTRTAPQAFRCSLLHYLFRSPSVCSVAGLPSPVRECVITHRIEWLLTATPLIAGIAVRTVLRLSRLSFIPLNRLAVLADHVRLKFLPPLSIHWNDIPDLCDLQSVLC